MCAQTHHDGLPAVWYMDCDCCMWGMCFPTDSWLVSLSTFCFPILCFFLSPSAECQWLKAHKLLSLFTHFSKGGNKLTWILKHIQEHIQNNCWPLGCVPDSILLWFHLRCCLHFAPSSSVSLWFLISHLTWTQLLQFTSAFRWIHGRQTPLSPLYHLSDISRCQSNPIPPWATAVAPITASAETMMCLRFSVKILGGWSECGLVVNTFLLHAHTILVVVYSRTPYREINCNLVYIVFFLFRTAVWGVFLLNSCIWLTVLRFNVKIFSSAAAYTCVTVYFRNLNSRI